MVRGSGKRAVGGGVWAAGKTYRDLVWPQGWARLGRALSGSSPHPPGWAAVEAQGAFSERRAQKRKCWRCLQVSGKTAQSQTGLGLWSARDVHTACWTSCSSVTPNQDPGVPRAKPAPAPSDRTRFRVFVLPPHPTPILHLPLLRPSNRAPSPWLCGFRWHKAGFSPQSRGWWLRCVWRVLHSVSPGHQQLPILHALPSELGSSA